MAKILSNTPRVSLVSEISILSPRKGLEISRGVGGFSKVKNLSKCMKLELEFPDRLGGGGMLKEKSLQWGRFPCQIVMQASCESRTVLSKLITETVRCARTLLTGSILYPHS